MVKLSCGSMYFKYFVLYHGLWLINSLYCVCCFHSGQKERFKLIARVIQNLFFVVY